MKRRRCFRAGRQVWLAMGLLAGAYRSQAHENYRERLHLARVGRTGTSIAAQFIFDLEFVIESRHVCPGEVLCGFDAMPAGLGTLVDELGVQELSFSLTNSWWEKKVWGRLPANPYYPRGLEIWARLDTQVPSDMGAEDRWRALLQGLGGLYRVQSSLLAQSPALQPRLLASGFGSESSEGRLFHGVLSREAPCIDNLEPFIRSLPCRDRHGLAAFLRQPSLLLEGDHLGLSLHIRRYCRGNEASEGGGACESPALHLERVVTVVRQAGANSSRSPLFQPPMPAATACPLSSSSTLHLPPGSVGESPTFPPGWLRVEPAASSSADVLVVSRSKGQQDVTRGVLRLWLENTDPHTDLVIQVMERVPYFLEPLLHLWALELSHDPSSPRRPDDLGRGFDWRTAEPGTKGDSVLEYEFRLAAAETAVVTMPFLNRFLHFEDFPPNPMRGLEVPAAIVTARCLDQGGGNESFQRYSSEALLIDLPTPDFSMPFNVITLSSTLLAFFFGTMINILVKKSGADKPSTDKTAVKSTVLTK